jgi:hypothetical protein
MACRRGYYSLPVVDLRAAAAFFLFGFKFFFVAALVTALPVTRFIELHFCGFAVGLDVLSFLATDHDRIVQLDVDNNDKFVRGRVRRTSA